MELEEIKTYRKQFEVEDLSFETFKPIRSNSPNTPKTRSRKQLLDVSPDSVGSGNWSNVNFFSVLLSGTNNPLMPIRHQNSDIGPV